MVQFLIFITSVTKNYSVIYANSIQLFYSEKKTKSVIESCNLINIADFQFLVWHLISLEDITPTFTTRAKQAEKSIPLLRIIRTEITGKTFLPPMLEMDWCSWNHNPPELKALSRHFREWVLVKGTLGTGQAVSGKGAHGGGRQTCTEDRGMLQEKGDGKGGTRRALNFETDILQEGPIRRAQGT